MSYPESLGVLIHKNNECELINFHPHINEIICRSQIWNEHLKDIDKLTENIYIHNFKNVNSNSNILRNFIELQKFM